jgi:hypothetical protein
MSEYPNTSAAASTKTLPTIGADSTTDNTNGFQYDITLVPSDVRSET